MKRTIYIILTCAIVLLGHIASIAQAETDDAKIGRLFMMASSGAVRFHDLVQPAKDSLAAMGETAAIGLARKLNATDARERLTLADIFAAIGPVAVPHVVPYLDSAGEYMPKNAARCLGRIADTSATLALIPKLNRAPSVISSPVSTTNPTATSARVAPWPSVQSAIPAPPPSSCIALPIHSSASDNRRKQL